MGESGAVFHEKGGLFLLFCACPVRAFASRAPNATIWQPYEGLLGEDGARARNLRGESA